MREIKFRAWWEFEDGYKMIGMEELWELDGEEFCIFTILTTPEERQDGEETVFMQYTGLKDKNGKEIYEGDIVQGHYIEYDPYFAEDNTHEFISDVKYIDNSFKVNRNTVNDEGRIRNYGYLHEWDSQQVEVIGNIFENKKLLEGGE